jgi:signal transduction histidine kinase
MRGFKRHDSRLWPVLAMLLAAALLPTACVLWFMGEAMRNERLASRQKLLEAYRAPLERVRARLDAHWDQRAGELPAYDPTRDPTAVFAGLIASGHVDSAVLLDLAGTVRYPECIVAIGEEAAAGFEWRAAEVLEFQARDFAGAAELYREAARTARDPALAVRARIACARCLARLGSLSEALDLLQQVVTERAYQNIRDTNGRLVVADAALLLLQFLDPAADRYQQVAHMLALLATDYRHGLLPAAQRRAIMEQLAPIVGAGAFPTLAAERLAAQYAETEPASPPVPGRLTRAPVAGCWQLASSDGTLVALYRESRITSELSAIVQSEAISGATVRLLQPDQRGPEPFLALAASEAMPGWQLALDLTGPDPFADQARRRTALYLWTGLAVALLTAMLTMLVGRHVGRQVRLTRLRNDLIATVSHELKTPLASIRALVDTLLDTDARDPRQTREYLQLVARENLRLSRLIDNFLAFSRMERNKHTFAFAGTPPAEVVSAAVDAAGKRFHSPGCHLEVKVAPGLPPVVADRDALVTVLLNLLDNAWKYTGDDKRITLSACAADGHVRFEVRDNGIGLSRRAMRRVFDRFYQVDQSLSRKAGGCGLGLSIVQFIVEAHGGAVSVESQPGKGSAFTVSLLAEPGEN